MTAELRKCRAVGNAENQKQVFRVPHEPLEIAPRFPHFAAPRRVCANSKQKQNAVELWTVEKWKSKSGISTFPPPRQPAAARKKITANRRKGDHTRQLKNFLRPGSFQHWKMLWVLR